MKKLADTVTPFWFRVVCLFGLAGMARMAYVEFFDAKDPSQLSLWIAGICAVLILFGLLLSFLPDSDEQDLL